MSSATSIDRDVPVKAGRAPGAAPPTRTDAGARARDTFRPWHFFVLASLLAATAAIVVTRQSRPEHLVIISLTIGAAGFAAVAFYRTLAPLVGPEGTLVTGPLTGSTRAALEREKLLVLRAIKELEFDRAMGKVSPKDFEEVAARLRARAMSVMRQLDATGGYRELIERELEARLRSLRAGETSRAVRPASETPAPAASRAACPCGTANDPDAAFCKRCGSRLEPSART